MSADCLVSGDVPADLMSPVGLITVRDSHVFWATVPETSVNEDGKTTVRKCEIGFPGDWKMSAPTGDAISFEDGKKTALSLLVAC